MQRIESFLVVMIIFLIIILPVFGLPSRLFSQSPYIQSVITSPSTINLGDWVAIEVKVQNIGTAILDGGITLSIPSFTSLSDDNLVININSTTGDSSGLLIRAKGDAVYNNNCDPIAAQYVLVEYADDNWVNSEISYLNSAFF